jgi:hypothetical protein
MPHPTTRTVWPSQFTPLVAYLAAQDTDMVTLTFAQIEVMIGRPLSVSAQVSSSRWDGRASRVGRDLGAIGWRAWLRVKQHTVEFRRIRDDG